VATVAVVTRVREVAYSCYRVSYSFEPSYECPVTGEDVFPKELGESLQAGSHLTVLYDAKRPQRNMLYAQMKRLQWTTVLDLEDKPSPPSSPSRPRVPTASRRGQRPWSA